MDPAFNQEYEFQSALFPGSQCFPLSPDPKNPNCMPKQGEEDQLLMIISKLGPLKEDDMCFLLEKKPKSYLKYLNREMDPSTSIEEDLKNYNPQLVEITRNLLEFNPYFRISAKEAILYTEFDSMRVKEFEKL